MDQRTVFLELGVGYNTPGIIKYPFWRMTAENPQAVYVCVNQGEAVCPREIAGRSVCLDDDIGEILSQSDQCMHTVKISAFQRKIRQIMIRK